MCLLFFIPYKKNQEGWANYERKPFDLKDQQEFIISALPGVGLNTARILLEHFGSIKKLVNASLEDLQQVEGVGPKISTKLKEVLEKEYKKD